MTEMHNIVNTVLKIKLRHMYAQRRKHFVSITPTTISYRDTRVIAFERFQADFVDVLGFLGSGRSLAGSEPLPKGTLGEMGGGKK